MSEILTYTGAGETPAPTSETNPCDELRVQLWSEQNRVQRLRKHADHLVKCNDANIKRSVKNAKEADRLRTAINAALDSAEAEGITHHRGTEEKREFYRILTDALETGQ